MSLKIQSIKFAIVGTLTAIIYYLFLFSLVEYFNVSIIIASSMAYVLAIIVNYLMHYQWTFNSDNPHKVAAFRFIMMNAGGFSINFLIMTYGLIIASEHYLLIQTFSLAVIVLWNFIISSLRVYKNRAAKYPQQGE